MELGKVSINRPEFKDFRKSLSGMHFFSDVILLDKSNANTRALVFQLREELRPCLANLDHLQNFNGQFEDAFVFVGEMSEIDPEKKIVRLTNELVYSYRHLINVTSSQESIEILTIIHTLKNALLLETLRIHQIIPSDELSPSTHSYKTHMPSEGTQMEIEKVVQPCIDLNTQQHQSPDIPSSNKTLCQVQL